jgi:hypothetical protein
MTILELSLSVSLLCCPAPALPKEGFARCVPSGIDLNAELVVETQRPTTKVSPRKTTVQQELAQLKAHCRRGKLVDGKGKQIYFYSLTGCWGNPPDNYLELLKQQEQEIRRLKKKYTVIQIPCAQSLDPRTISKYSPR